MRLLTGFGIRHVQLFRNKDKQLSAADIRRVLDDCGVQAASLHAFFGPGWDPSEPDEQQRLKTVDGLRGEADFVRDLGGDLVVIHPGADSIGDETRNPRRIDALRRSSESLARIGEAAGVVMALENLQKGQMGDDMALLRDIVDAINSPHLGLNLDIGHAQLATGDPSHVARQAGPRLVGTHIHDNSGAGDEHFVPGYGVIDMDATCRTLGEIGYRGDFTLEVMETVDSVRQRITPAWIMRLMKWIDLAGGNA